MNFVTLTSPARDVVHQVFEGRFDLDAKTITYGPATVPMSEAAKTEIKKCLDEELPKIEGYKSHEVSVAAKP